MYYNTIHKVKKTYYQIPRPKFLTSVIKTLAAFCLILIGDHTVRAQSLVITNIFPNGSYQFQATNKLAFNVISSANVTNITVSLQTTPLGGATILEVSSIGGGLTITGTGTSNNVSVSLSSNAIYAGTISVADANGNVSSANLNFDTIAPAYTWEAVDWDDSNLTPNYFDNPQINKYVNLSSISGVDYNNVSPGSGSASYRPQGLETENPNSTGDTARSQYLNTTNIDCDVGYNDGGNWANYTRKYKAGTYNVFVRASNGSGSNPQNDACSLSVMSGTAAFSGAGPNQFSIPNGGWNTWHWVQLIDSSSGSPAQITFDGTASTLRLDIDGGNCNEHFFMLVPVNTNPPPTPSIVFTNVYPDGIYQFEQANTFSFTVDSTNGVNVSSIIAEVSGTNLLGQGFGPEILSGANGLTVTGSSASYTVTFPLTTNTMYTVFLQALDNNGTPSTTTLSFDTISSGYYTFEAEDWDFGGGMYYDNPQDGNNAIDTTFPAANEYYFLDSVPEEDFHMVGGISGYNAYAYRGTYSPPTYTALNTEGSGDKKRVQYTNSLPGADWDNGNTHAGDWGNYTRHYPATGVWNIYMRAANGQQGNGGRGTVAVVTNGFQTTNLQTSLVGTFAAVPPTANWQVYTWIPLVDNGGNLVKFDPTKYYHNADGSMTLQYASGGGYNANFFMFVPADNSLPTVANLYPDGLVQFEKTNKLAFTAGSSLGIATNNITLTLNGANVSTNLVFTGSSTSWNVSYVGLQSDTNYSAVINVKNNAGAVYSQAFSFNTFDSSYYQWESVDWNYTDTNTLQSGLYFDNPQVNAYANLHSTQGIDEGQSNPNTLNNPFDYRPYDQVNLTPSQEPASDVPRPQFAAAGQVDYKGEYVENGTWMDYTRHYPKGTYYVLGTFTSGNSVNTSATLSKVTSSPTVANQTTSLLGTFIIPVSGWGTFSYDYLTDSGGNLVKVTFDGSASTLQFEGNPSASDGLTCNTGFFMLIPTVAAPGTVQLTDTIAGGNIIVSFLTQTGHSYQLQATSSLSGGSWSNVGSAISGNGSTETASDTIGSGSRFYRVEIQ